MLNFESPKIQSTVGIQILRDILHIFEELFHYSLFISEDLIVDEFFTEKYLFCLLRVLFDFSSLKIFHQNFYREWWIDVWISSWISIKNSLYNRRVCWETKNTLWHKFWKHKYNIVLSMQQIRILNYSNIRHY